MITIYHPDGSMLKVHPIDAKDHLRNGWTTTQEPAIELTPEPTTEPEDQFSGMTNAQLKEYLVIAGVEIPHNANKATLLKLCRE